MYVAFLFFLGQYISFTYDIGFSFSILFKLSNLSLSILTPTLIRLDRAGKIHSVLTVSTAHITYNNKLCLLASKILIY